MELWNQYEYGIPITDNARTAASQAGASASQLATKASGAREALQQNRSGFDEANVSDAAGRRVRLRPKPAATTQVYGADSSIMGKILTQTKGVVWPYQPTINYAQDVEYTSMDLVHTNQEFYSYKGTKAVKLTVSGNWSVQNNKEGLYALACIRFFQTVTKMYFGGAEGTQVEGLRGTPPPVLLFDAYGKNMFNCLPVIVTNFTISLPQDVNYFPVDLSQLNVTNPNSFNSNLVTADNLEGRTDIAWLPVLFTIETSLTVQNTPKKLRQFDLDKFRTGQLIRDGGWI